MTWRELIEQSKQAASDIGTWIQDIFSKLSNGQFLDLTIGQTVAIAVVIYLVIYGAVDEYRNKKAERVEREDGSE